MLWSCAHVLEHITCHSQHSALVSSIATSVIVEFCLFEYIQPYLHVDVLAKIAALTYTRSPPILAFPTFALKTLDSMLK